MGICEVLADSLGSELATQVATAEIVVKLEENSTKVEDTDVSEGCKQIQTAHRQDYNDHELTSVLWKGDFGYNISSNKRKKARCFNDRKKNPGIRRLGP